MYVGVVVDYIVVDRADRVSMVVLHSYSSFVAVVVVVAGVDVVVQLLYTRVTFPPWIVERWYDAHSSLYRRSNIVNPSSHRGRVGNYTMVVVMEVVDSVSH